MVRQCPKQWGRYMEGGFGGLRGYRGGIEIVKVKAHTTWWDVLAKKITARNRAGNHSADQEAKKALQEAKREAPVSSFNAHLARAALWTRWLVRYAENFVNDTTPDPEQADGQRILAGEGGALHPRQRTTMTHEKWSSGGRILCRRCGRDETEAGAGTRVLDDACKGSAGGRALAHATGCANHIWREHRHTEGELIVKGGTMLQASRVPVNMVEEEDTPPPERPQRSYAAVGAGQLQPLEPPPLWLQDPQWLYLPHLTLGQQERKEDGQERTSRDKECAQGGRLHRGSGGHLLRVTGPMVWCARCACHALKRHGTGLKGACVVRKQDATHKRLQRLHAGRHPVSGAVIG